MPYNTRRKSLSLPSLGIHLPVTNAARAAAKTLSLAAAQLNNSNTSSNSSNTSTTTTNNKDTTTPLSATIDTTSSQSQPSSLSTSDSFSSFPTSASSSASPNSSINTPLSTTPATMPSSISPKRPVPVDATSKPSNSNKRVKLRNPSSSVVSALTPSQTPPSSPKRHVSVEVDNESDDFNIYAPVDMDGVVDDVVEAVIELLQKNRNRPLLIKELENHLRLRLKSVQQSANPQAIICSRLSSFMKRPVWSKSRKCPLAKELENTHPRRTYYYLTTCPNQPLPDPTSVHFIVPRTMATPPISTISTASESVVDERRRDISPSPEVELDTPDLEFDDDFLTPSTPNSFNFNHPPNTTGTDAYHCSQRGASPPLERDEREFTQTAEGLQKQKNAGNRFMLTSFAAESNPSYIDSPSSTEGHSLFGHQSRQLATPSTTGMFGISSPVLRPASLDGAPVPSIPKQDDAFDLHRYHTQVESGWDDETELVSLDELDRMLN